MERREYAQKKREKMNILIKIVWHFKHYYSRDGLHFENYLEEQNHNLLQFILTMDLKFSILGG